MTERLTLNTFTTASSDPEGCQYRILACLKSYYEDFAASRLYPSLSDLIDLLSNLQQIIQNKNELESRFPQSVIGIDLEKKKLLLERDADLSADVQRLTEMIEWAIPLLHKAIREGTEIYEFVDEQVGLREVGILPIQLDEGYAIIPDNRGSSLRVVRYELSLFEQDDEKFRAIRTKLIKTIPQGEIRSEAGSIKIEIIREHPELPNPATFEFHTDLAFPFVETILPVSKRKLMARVAA